MQIVIEIPKEKELIDKALWNDVSDFDKEDLVIVLNAIAHGTPLPKGHGRIIDESQVTGTFTWDNGFIECFAPTIIEADKE